MTVTVYRSGQLTFRSGGRCSRPALGDLVTLTTRHPKKGDKIRLNGLGILQVRKRAARMGRNPVYPLSTVGSSPSKFAGGLLEGQLHVRLALALAGHCEIPPPCVLLLQRTDGDDPPKRELDGLARLPAPSRAAGRLVSHGRVQYGKRSGEAQQRRPLARIGSAAPKSWSETSPSGYRFGRGWLPDTTASVRRDPQLVQRKRRLMIGMSPRPPWKPSTLYAATLP